jgi:hypothetical protein
MAIRASLQDAAGQSPPPQAVQVAAPGPVSLSPSAEATIVEAIQMGFPSDQVRRVQANRQFSSTAALVEHLVSGGGAGGAAAAHLPPPAPSPAPAFGQVMPSARELEHEDAMLRAAIQASLRDLGRPPVRTSGGGAEGSAMDPAHTFRSLLINTLRGDDAMRHDLVKAFEDLSAGKTRATPRLIFFLLDNCKMDKLSRLPANIQPLWTGYLQRAPPQPTLKQLIVIEGQLGKQGSKKWDTKGWKMKWFVLTDSMLLYYDQLQDKQAGKTPKKSIALSSIIRLHVVPTTTSGEACSFEIITEQDNPNWKVHANISDDPAESQLYSSRWQSAVEEAVRGARDLERAFVNAKPHRYWSDLDDALRTGVTPGGGEGVDKAGVAAATDAGEGMIRRGGASRPGVGAHRRIGSATSSDFDPREFDSDSPRSSRLDDDPFAAQPQPTPDLFGDLLSSGDAASAAKAEQLRRAVMSDGAYAACPASRLGRKASVTRLSTMLKRTLNSWLSLATAASAASAAAAAAAAAADVQTHLARSCSRRTPRLHRRRYRLPP